MRRIQNMATVCLLVMVCWGLLGCASMTRQEAMSKIEEAQVYYDSLEEWGIGAYYPDDTRVAKDKLEGATMKVKIGMNDGAKKDATESLSASKSALRKHYNEIIAKKARELKNEIKAEITKDPDTSLQDFIPELEDIISYADEIDENQQKVTLERVLLDQNKIQEEIPRSIESYVAETMQSDVTFRVGRYSISNNGKTGLEAFVKNIIKSQDAFQKGTGAEPLSQIKIKTVGYTDEIPFIEGTRLVRELLAGEGNVPRRGVARRKFLNKKLSLFRAREINGYIIDELKKYGQGSGALLHSGFEKEIIGNGEIKPQLLVPPFNMDDPRRRICKIYVYIRGMKKETSISAK